MTMLLRVRWLLKRRGFADTVAYAASHPVGPVMWTNHTKEHAAAAAIANRVGIAAAFFPGRARCLEQAIAAYLLLRRHGIRSDLFLGVRAHRFQAHAWIEHDGIPLNEHTDMVRKVIPILVLQS
jgi:hypothetical protein